ncbi:MAG: hypothetical protein KDD11_15495 [Acidobacteria bacterium]|nr:hypothetical protein [Acidobacteriota bacterium]
MNDAPIDDRLERIRGGIAAHHAGVEPDPSFSARVLARVGAEPDTAGVLGWAAARLLPVAGLLAALLVAWVLVSPPELAPEDLLADQPSAQELTLFLLSGTGGAP